MTEALFQLDGLALLAASVAHFFLGGVWFAVLFARPYAAALGLAGGPSAKPRLRFLAGPFFCSAANIATTAVLVKALGVVDIVGALTLGLLVALGYLVPMTVNIAINPLFPRPFLYSLVSAPMFLIGSLLSSVILVAVP